MIVAVEVRELSRTERDEWSLRLYETHRRAWADARAQSLVRATLTDDEWSYFIQHPLVSVFVAWQGSEPIGVFLVARDARIVDWLEVEALELRWPGQAVWYFVNASVPPEHASSGVFGAMLEAIFDAVDPDQVVLFDTAAMNTPAIGNSIEGRAVARWGPSSATVPIERQRFWALQAGDAVAVDFEQFFSVLAAPTRAE